MHSLSLALHLPHVLCMSLSDSVFFRFLAFFVLLRALLQVAPCTYMLGTLFSNSLLLVGGMVMCFVTSWRLSMLAFTTVGPIYHITQVVWKTCGVQTTELERLE